MTTPAHPAPPFALVDASRRDPLGPAPLMARHVPRALHDLAETAPYFRPGPRLVTAVNVALAVGAPLLLTGEPGTGKTQLAWYLRWYFGLKDVKHNRYTLNVKSTSVARDLLYTFDMVEYFHASQDEQRQGPLDKKEFVTRGPLWHAFDDLREGRPAVVLIDEIDKAPRDFPNDLLHELDQYAFTVRETGDDIVRPREAPPPVIVITSNEERRLPAPFLRRCVFHHIAFDAEVLRAAVAARRAFYDRLDDDTIHAAERRLMTARDDPGVRRKPATAEFLVWLAALNAMGATAAQIEGVRFSQLPAVEALIKDSEDLQRLG